jgi:hypothetical protein
MSHGYQAVQADDDIEQDDFFEPQDSFEDFGAPCDAIRIRHDVLVAERSRRRTYIGIGALSLVALAAIVYLVVSRQDFNSRFNIAFHSLSTQASQCIRSACCAGCNQQQ